MTVKQSCAKRLCQLGFSYDWLGWRASRPSRPLDFFPIQRMDGPACACQARLAKVTRISWNFQIVGKDTTVVVPVLLEGEAQQLTAYETAILILCTHIIVTIQICL